MRMNTAAAVLQAQRARWSRARFERAAARGAFEGERVELVAGELVDMAPEGVPHGNTIEWLTEVLVPALVGRARVRVQLSFVIDDDTQLVPDFAILEAKTTKTGHPTTALLVIEVSDSSARYDRLVKSSLYASAGVRAYWVVDLGKRVVEVFSAPTGKRFGSHQRLREGQLAVPQFDEVTIDLEQLFAVHD